MRPRKFDDDDLDKAEALRARGEKWVVVEALLGDGIKGACDYRRTHKGGAPFCSCNQGRLPCTCKPSAWLLQGVGQDFPVLTEQEANEILCAMPEATKKPLFMRG